jgi:hypothetical protein
MQFGFKFDLRMETSLLSFLVCKKSLREVEFQLKAAFYNNIAKKVGLRQ